VAPPLWPKGRRTSWGILPEELISSSRIERLRPRVFCTEVEVVEEELIFSRGCEKLMEEGESP
jgi:hypothetical protein